MGTVGAATAGQVGGQSGRAGAPLAVRLAAVALCGLLGACATRSVAIRPLAVDATEFATWDCLRIDDETDRVQQRAADVAYAVDERVAQNILALGVGVAVFWPALLALRPDGLEAAELAQLKGRFEALRAAARQRGCAPAGTDLPPERVAQLPVAPGESLVYEDRDGRAQPATEWSLQVQALRRTEVEYRSSDAGSGPWRQDRSGNLWSAPAGKLHWPRLLRSGLDLGQLAGGDMWRVGDDVSRARLRGQVVAVGPQTVAGRRFDAAVVELFGDAPLADAYTRVDGVIVVDRASGVLLRLDLRSAQPGFVLQRRLVRVEAAPTVPVVSPGPGPGRGPRPGP